jgi:dipeptidyl aminopeptidase/acylaminoacyl peptidase
MHTTFSIRRLSAPLIGALLVAGAVGLPSAAGPGQASSAQTTVATRSPNGAPRLTLEAISRDNAKWIGTPPSDVRWSVDGQHLYFTWNPDGADVAELYTMPASGGVPTKVPHEQRRFVVPDGARFNRAKTHRVYDAFGDIFVVTLADGSVRQITSTDAAERNPHFTFDGKAVTFERDNNLFASDLATGLVRQLTNFRTGRDPDEDPKGTDQQEYLEKQQMALFGYLQKTDRLDKERKAREKAERGGIDPYYLKDGQRVADLQLSPDGRFVTFVLSDRAPADKAKVTEMPKYVTKSGFAEMQRLNTGFDMGRVKAGEPVMKHTLGSLTSATGAIAWIDHGQTDRAVSMNAPVWSEDGQHAVAWVGAVDHKDAWLLVIDPERATSRVIVHEHDEAWVRGFRTGRIAQGDDVAYGFMPDNQNVYFLSERDGFYHLYTASLSGGAAKPLTSGSFELADLRMSRDRTTWYFTSTEVHPGEHQVYSMPIAGGARTRLTPEAGWYNYTLSPDEKTIALVYTHPTEPGDLFLMPNRPFDSAQGRPSAQPRRLTTSTTEEFRRYAWQPGEIVTFDDGEGHTIYAEVWKPARPHPARPAVIQVHGAGWAQGVAKRWGGAFPFMQYLAQEGYTVMNLDYRGSRGYGRDFRTGIYRHMGETEIKSSLAAVEVLVKQYKVDRQRIGIYGASYGGFFTLMALFKHPGVFAAGAAHAPVTDWAHYNHSYTTRILNNPFDDTQAYERSSPIYFADRLKDHLLITHGVQDDNVHFQDSVRLAQRLMELRKDNWDLIPYPVEPHGFQQDYSRLDEMRRRVKLFDRVLKGPRSGVSATM